MEKNETTKQPTTHHGLTHFNHPKRDYEDVESDMRNVIQMVNYILEWCQQDTHKNPLIKFH